jgi:hypothetical protein
MENCSFVFRASLFNPAPQIDKLFPIVAENSAKIFTFALLTFNSALLTFNSKWLVLVSSSFP